ncbi:MAG: FAD-binding oxidoreductase [Caulobacteraceae bacterium]
MSVAPIALSNLPPIADLQATLAQIVGAPNVHADEARLRLHSEDIWKPADQLAALIVAPATTEELAQAVRAIAGAGCAIAPRGGGMSYTGGYVPTVARTVSIDTSRMDKIVRISREDMTVTVQAGVTWQALNAALAPLKLRTPFWGPMSGLKSTIGGGVSQLNAMFGAGHHGTTSESVVALTVVLPNGETLRTGARGPYGETPFYRHFGPDLTGLFCGDCGAFGIKAEITLRLMTAPAHEDYLSFSFQTGEGLLRAMAEIARAGLACETCAFDPGLTAVRLARASMSSDLKTLGAVVAKEKSLAKGLFSAAKIAMAGRKIVEADEFPLHVVCEGRSAAAVKADVEAVRQIAAAEGGAEIENTIAKVIRAAPFPALNSMVGPTGEAWVPIHGVVSLSTAPAVLAEIQALYAALKPVHDALGIHTGFLFTTLSSNAIIIEPVFYWPQGWREVHASAIEPVHLARLTERPANADATARVIATREQVLAIFVRYGAGHFQIGRTYPYRESRDAASTGLLDALKVHLDPDGQINPGVLGFAISGAQA